MTTTDQKNYQYVFNPGSYYIGDPGYVLDDRDLRNLLWQLIYDNFENGHRDLLSSFSYEEKINTHMCNRYWVVKMKNNCGTLFDNNGESYGYDWGTFGVVPFMESFLPKGKNHQSNIITFDDPFECYLDKNNNIVVGDLFFDTGV